jgi:hypothetical protein
MLFTRKMAAFSILSASALMGTVTMSAVPAHAASAQEGAASIARAAILCNGDVCTQDVVGDTSQTITAWANKTSFSGHFELQFGCHDGSCNTTNSSNGYWPHGGKHWSIAITSAVISQCVLGWKGPSSTGTYTKVGEECFSSL